jgi:hypothetical protein
MKIIKRAAPKNVGPGRYGEGTQDQFYEISVLIGYAP